MLHIKNCENIYDIANCLRLSVKSITYILYYIRTENCYSEFTIPKKNGMKRQICAPNKQLRSIQKRLAKALYEELEHMRKKENINSKISHAFEKGKSIITNCEIHKKKRFILNVDLDNFFDHFHYGRVYGYFLKNKYFSCNDEVARVLANLVCFHGKLPQGAPTSPIITNLIFQIVDMRILQLTKKYHLDYTRYADDLTFSTNRKDFVEIYKEFFKKLNAILNRSGFEINNNKIRLSFHDSRQTVTGLVVNEKINVCKDYYKLVRTYAHSFYKTGTFDIKDENGKTIKKGASNQLEGMFSFIYMIDSHKKEKKKDAVKQQQSLNKRDREYQRFLFYKYFYSNDKPLIITEGKTDSIYLYCALKKYYLDFPELIEKNNNGFSLKIQFMKKSKRIEDMFSLVKDGADTMSNFYKNFYTSNNNFPDYYKYFFNLTHKHAANPVLFIFDNEINNKKKPLYFFINVLRENCNDFKETIKDIGWSRITSDKNLYVVTNQLINDMSECEIEDLFNKETLEFNEQGKTFSREKNIDKNKHFGKSVFSKIIARNYKQIDFSNFIPFLERIRFAIKDYSDTSK